MILFVNLDVTNLDAFVLSDALCLAACLLLARSAYLVFFALAVEVVDNYCVVTISCSRYGGEL